MRKMKLENGKGTLYDSGGRLFFLLFILRFLVLVFRFPFPSLPPLIAYLPPYEYRIQKIP
jgi:hypothetical protein